MSQFEKVFAKKLTFFFGTISMTILHNVEYVGNTRIVYCTFFDNMKENLEYVEILPLFQVDSKINF